jgi:hypothetical protein
MNRESRGRELRAAAMPDSAASWCGAKGRPAEERRERLTTRDRATDLDLLRLSCICRADAMLQGLPERSRVLASIHRLFDSAPYGALLDELLVSALMDPARCRSRVEAATGDPE